MERFNKDWSNRLLAVKEQLTAATYRHKPAKRVWPNSAFTEPGYFRPRSGLDCSVASPSLPLSLLVPLPALIYPTAKSSHGVMGFTAGFRFSR